MKPLVFHLNHALRRLNDPRLIDEPRPSSRSAFTFAEVLFAVMILGIGFILVAAVLPVAIRQNRANVDQSTARNVALAALAELRTAARDANSDLPATGPAPAPYKSANLSNFTGSRVSAFDPRFQWSVVYRRETGQPAADVYIIVQRIPREILGQTVYNPNWLAVSGHGCEPQRVEVKLYKNGPQIEFTDTQGQAAAIQGAYVICEDASLGSWYRLSTRSSANTWNVDPSSPQVVADSGTTHAYIIGSALVDPTLPWSAANPYDGPAQDVYLLKDSVTVNP